MKRFIKYAAPLFLGLALFVTDADAKRLGGGSSSGMRRDSSVMQRQATPAPAPAPHNAAPAPSYPQSAPAATPQSNRSRWLGPLAGLAAGLGLGALLGGGFGGGFGSGLLSMLLMGVAAFVVIRLVAGLFSKNKHPEPMAYAPAGPAHQDYQPAPSRAPVIGGGLASSAPSAPSEASIPADFDAPGFLRHAKLNFVRLQAANDVGNMDDIKEVTTPEMYAEIKLQYQERGGQTQQTDVVEVDAVLLDVSSDAQRHIASVRFHGRIREEKNGPVNAFNEVWHLVKPLDGSHGWLIAGIQQAD